MLQSDVFHTIKKITSTMKLHVIQKLYLTLLLFISLPVAVQAQTTNYKAYSVFLYSFTKYIEWPADARQGDFVIAVLGNQKLLQEMQTGVAGRKAGSQTIKVIESKNASDLNGVHMIFISDLKSGSTEDIVKQFNGKPVLVVTERDGLVKKGAGISFIVADDNTLKFQVNEQTLIDQHLKASSAIVSLAYKGI
jgi:hypothetical protein